MCYSSVGQFTTFSFNSQEILNLEMHPASVMKNMSSGFFVQVESTSTEISYRLAISMYLSNV